MTRLRGYTAADRRSLPAIPPLAGCRDALDVRVDHRTLSGRPTTPPTTNHHADNDFNERGAIPVRR